MVLSHDFICFSWLSVISLIISCFARGFLSFFINGFREEYLVILIPTIRIVKFTIRFSTSYIALQLTKKSVLESHVLHYHLLMCNVLV